MPVYILLFFVLVAGDILSSRTVKRSFRLTVTACYYCGAPVECSRKKPNVQSAIQRSGKAKKAALLADNTGNAVIEINACSFGEQSTHTAVF